MPSDGFVSVFIIVDHRAEDNIDEGVVLGHLIGPPWHDRLSEAYLYIVKAILP